MGYALETQTRPLFDSGARSITLAHELSHQWFGDDVTPTQVAGHLAQRGLRDLVRVVLEPARGRDRARGRCSTACTRPARTTPASGTRRRAIPAGPRTCSTASIYDRGGMTLEALRAEGRRRDVLPDPPPWVSQPTGTGTPPPTSSSTWPNDVSGTDLTGFLRARLFRPIQQGKATASLTLLGPDREARPRGREDRPTTRRARQRIRVPSASLACARPPRGSPQSVASRGRCGLRARSRARRRRARRVGHQDRAAPNPGGDPLGGASASSLSPAVTGSAVQRSSQSPAGGHAGATRTPSSSTGATHSEGPNRYASELPPPRIPWIDEAKVGLTIRRPPRLAVPAAARMYGTSRSWSSR